jgi:hypothetical protein
MMRTRIALKRLDDRSEGLDIEMEVDRRNKLVTLHMLEFEAGLVADFLVRSLPSDHGVCVETDSSVRTLPRFDLVIVLAGRPYPARLIRLSEGHLALRLLAPDAKCLARRSGASSNRREET